MLFSLNIFNGNQMHYLLLKQFFAYKSSYRIINLLYHNIVYQYYKYNIINSDKLIIITIDKVYTDFIKIRIIIGKNFKEK